MKADCFNNYQLKWLSLFIFFILLLGVSSCKESKPVVIGFVTDLSSRNAELGIQARNGLQLAVDELNESGGLLGKSVQLLIRNHKGDKELCFQAVSELVENHVDVLIGPMASSMASSVIDAASISRTLIISPTVSTDELTGIDDMFLRVIAPASKQGYFLAQKVKAKEHKKVVLILDKKNEAYVASVAGGFINEFNENDPIVIEEIYFQDKEDFLKIVDQIEVISPDAILFAASGIDTSAIVQLYAKNNSIPQLYGSSWVKATRVADYGGRTVEGMIIADSFKNKIPNDREILFNKIYTDRFSKQANIAARSTYESILLFARAVKETNSLDSDIIKSSILNMEIIEGILDDFRLDQYGDGIRKLSYFEVINNQIILLDPNE